MDALRQKFTTQLTEIEILDTETINLVKDTDVETEVSETQIYLDKYSDFILKIGNVLKPQSQNNGNQSDSQATTTVNQSKLSSNKEAKVRLPKIDFDGNPLNFQNFWDLFESTVDKNEHLSDVDKFSYSKNFLSSSAAATLSGLTLTNGNYEEAVNLLKERY